MPKTLKEMKEFDKKNEINLHLYNDILYKVIPADKLVDLGLTEEYTTSTGKAKTRKAKGKMKQYIIITFLEKQWNIKDIYVTIK